MIPGGTIWKWIDGKEKSCRYSICFRNGGGFVKKMNKEGFSLIELVIAMAVTVVVMSGIITLIAYSTRSMNLTQARAALQVQAS